ncbi:endolytic transglycosylase MltG [Rhodohalobacter sp. 8-1]|uniref:endolytic transglycosylase MltG n=1 Tax=Rhodohalobacter sp. 8-1 TaxID=3131972 RepID=UPI0030EDBC26
MIYFKFREFLAALLILLIGFTAVFGTRYTRLYSEDSITTDGTVELLVYERIGFEELHTSLDSLNVDVDYEEFKWAANLLGWRSFRPGRYEINSAISYPELLSNLARGIQDPGNVVVHSGITPELLSERLANQLQADSLSFLKLFTDSSVVARELGLTGEELFSRMLPNTYQMYWTSSPDAVVRRIYREFEQNVANELAQEIARSSFSLGEVITLASIVEWEAKDANEKARISGLYQNRIKRNMRLQADPTVLYALGERRRLLYEDYTYEHPYNTYMNAGLPPGPITNPDLRSIRAVLNPEEHDYLFMVATPEGNHDFNETFDEHRESSENWRRWIREQYRIKRQVEREEAINQ